MEAFPCWFTFSMDAYSCQFEPDDEFRTKGLVFDDATDDFINIDPAFANTRPVNLDELHLVKCLRTNAVDDNIPAEAFEFYKSCTKNVSDIYMPLLECLIKKSAQIQKLTDSTQAGSLLKFFSLSLQTKPNFGQHPILLTAASAYESSIKPVLRDIGMDLQKEAQLARENANLEILRQMKQCKQDFLDLAQAEWARLNYNMSKHNILDQRFIVNLKSQTGIMSELDVLDNEDDYNEVDDGQGSAKKVANDDNFCVLSTFLYSLAMHDGNKRIENEILRRRAQISSARVATKALIDKQAAVSLKADTASLPDIAQSLSRRFEAIESTLQVNANAVASSKIVSDADLSTTLAARLDSLANVVEKVQNDAATNALTSPAASAMSATKNGSGAAPTLSRTAARNAVKRARQLEKPPPTRRLLRSRRMHC